MHRPIGRYRHSRQKITDSLKTSGRHAADTNIPNPNADAYRYPNAKLLTILIVTSIFTILRVLNADSGRCIN